LKVIFIGIDPGKTGGLAALDSDGSIVALTKMPDTEAEILRWLRACGPLSVHGTAVRAVLEKVAGGLHAGKQGRMGVSSAFTFGAGYGGLRMALVASGVPFDEAIPATWQKAMQCRSGGDKNVTKRRAQELFPLVQVAHATADALLLAEYARRTAILHGTPKVEDVA
jgi:hypothetical protein